jgi:hypothetical protein
MTVLYDTTIDVDMPFHALPGVVSWWMSTHCIHRIEGHLVNITVLLYYSSPLLSMRATVRVTLGSKSGH